MKHCMDVKAKLRLMREFDEKNRLAIENWRKEQMCEKKITGVLIDVQNGTASVTTLDKSLDAYYAALNCRCIDIARRTIGGRAFEIICDDEGAITGDPVPSGISKGNTIELYGNLFIVKFDGVEDVESLTEDEQQHVLHNTRTICIQQGKGRYKAIQVLRNVGIAEGV